MRSFSSVVNRRRFGFSGISRSLDLEGFPCAMPLLVWVSKWFHLFPPPAYTKFRGTLVPTHLDTGGIDELGYIPFEREATDLLFQVISRRYERQSVAISTNLAFTDWTNIFPDPMAATALIDRLVHHGAIYEFAGESQRLKSRQRRGKSPDSA